MGKIVRTSDFIGKYAISQNSFNITDLQAFIDKYEKEYVYDLLGIALGKLFLNDITTNFSEPETQKYNDLYNSMYEDNTGSYNGEIRSDGVKEMLLGFIYWEFVKSNTSNNTITGNVVMQNETSQQTDWNLTEVYNNYNEAVKTHRAIQIYINNNPGAYPEFNGKMKVINHWAI